MDLKTCEHCSKHFYPDVKHPFVRFCGKNCRTKAWTKTHPPKKRIRTKVVAGDRFPPEMTLLERMLICNQDWGLSDD